MEKIRAVVANQRGGVGKTTTALTLGRYLADQDKRVLIVDTDPQGSVSYLLGLTPKNFLFHFTAKGYAFSDCIVPAHDRIDVMCSSRETTQAEAALMGAVGREQAFVHLFRPVEEDYDAVLFDVAPSVSLLQTCALVYCGHALIPVDMDALSFHGAVATHELARILNEVLRAHVTVAAILPTQVNKQLQMTKVITKSLEAFSERTGIPILPAIRTDTTISKAAKEKTFLQDFDPGCRALEDYTAAFERLIPLLEATPTHAQAQAQA